MTQLLARTFFLQRCLRVQLWWSPDRAIVPVRGKTPHLLRTCRAARLRRFLPAALRDLSCSACRLQTCLTTRCGMHRTRVYIHNKVVLLADWFFARACMPVSSDDCMTQFCALQCQAAAVSPGPGGALECGVVVL